MEIFSPPHSIHHLNEGFKCGPILNFMISKAIMKARAVKMFQFLFSIKRAQVSDTMELNMDMIVKEPGGLYFAEELLSTSSCVYECQSDPR